MNNYSHFIKYLETSLALKHSSRDENSRQENNLTNLIPEMPSLRSVQQCCSLARCACCSGHLLGGRIRTPCHSRAISNCPRRCLAPDQSGEMGIQTIHGEVVDGS